MYDVVANGSSNSTTTFGRPLPTMELAIHEFDQWTNPKSAMLAPTTICWTQPDLVLEPAQ